MKHFLAKYGIGEEYPQDIKYKTKAAQYYRDRLEAMVTGQDFTEEEPPIEEGKMLLQFTNSNYKADFKPITNTDYPER